MEREYIVVVNKGIDLTEFDAEMAAEQGHGPIPSRAVDIANPRLGSRRMTHWMLTDEEAEELRDDPRVLSVEIPPEQRTDIQIGLRAYQSGNFYRGSTGVNSEVNWGLRRVVEQTNVYGTGNTVLGDYQYALDGTGVDVVIQDSGIQPDHPDFNDYSGTTRVQQIDWYTASGLPGTQSANHYRDLDGHGTHCAGIAAGLTYGWAKGAHVYSQKLAGLETLQGADGTGIPIADAFDAIRLWHSSKTNGRPTVVNMSWGYTFTTSADPTSGNYQGSGWVYGADYNTDEELWTGTGIVTKYGDGSRRMPVQVASIDAEIDDMIAAGIIVCIAAGNDYYKADVFGGTDYDNYVNIGGQQIYYHRPSSPYSDEAFIVGNIDSATVTGTSTDKTADSSKKGPAVNIWAPGTDIMSTSSNQADAVYTLYEYPNDSNYNIMSISGTSMAAPQIAGVAALYLQVHPEATPKRVFDKLVAESTTEINSTSLDDDYTNVANSIMGSEQRHVYTKYGRQPYAITGTVSINT